MLGLMQTHPLLISSLLEHGNTAHPYAGLVSRTGEGTTHRCTFAEIDRLLLPGPSLDAQSLYELMREFGATAAIGVPTVWLMLQGPSIRGLRSLIAAD
jgi:hypothetical protein